MVSWESLLFLVVLQVITVLLGTWLLNWLLSREGIQVEFKQCLLINLVGIFLDNLTPGAKLGGEGARFFLFRNLTQAKVSELVKVLLLQKVIVLLPLILLSAFSWLDVKVNILLGFVCLLLAGRKFIIPFCLAIGIWLLYLGKIVIIARESGVYLVVLSLAQVCFRHICWVCCLLHQEGWAFLKFFLLNYWLKLGPCGNKLEPCCLSIVW